MFENSIDIFSSRDKIRTQLIDMARKYLKLENFEFSQQSYLSYLIDILSVQTANLLFYNSSIYKELFLTKAIQRDSVINHAITIGYKIPQAQPSSVDILIKIPLTTFPAGKYCKMRLVGRNHLPTSSDELNLDVFKVYSSDNIPFSLKNTTYIDINVGNTGSIYISKYNYEKMNDDTISDGFQPIDFRIVNNELQFYLPFLQIQDVTESFTIPSLRPYDFYNLKFNFKQSGSLSNLDVFFVETQGNSITEVWTQKDSLFLLSAGEPGYEFREIDNGAIVSFGNGIIGKQPTNGSICFITSGLTQGVSGNCIAGSIIKNDAAFYYIDDNTNDIKAYKATINVINTSPAQGGKNSASVDFIRREAIKNVSMNNRLVSENDYKNIKTILPLLPIDNVFQVLKRSDIKSSEICLFTDLIYDDYVVPTKNIVLEDLTPDSIDPDRDIENIFTVRTGHTISIDDEDYMTLFDIQVNTDTLESTYIYYNDKISVPVIISENAKTTGTSKDLTRILPVFASFETDRTGSPENLIIELHTMVVDKDSTYVCKINLDWTPSSTSNREFYINKDIERSADSTSSLQVFTTQGDSSSKITLKLSEVPDGLLTFTFTIREYDSTKLESEYLLINKSKCSVIIRKNLSEFMYSQVEDNTFDPEKIGYMSADTNNDYMLSLDEITNAIALYNAGGYHIDSSGQYVPGSTIDPSGVPYSQDYNPQDWRISSAELLRILQLYNTSGGVYHPAEGTEDNFDFGPVDTTTYTPKYNIYDTPVIKKDYYNSLIDKGLFSEYILQKISKFDINNYKMLTDFVNLKFPNTTGVAKNMKYNTLDWGIVYDTDMTALPTVTEIDIGKTWAYSSDNNPWNISDYSYRKGGEVVTLDSIDDSGNPVYIFQKMKINDMFKAYSIKGEEQDEAQILIYNGDSFEKPEVSIPVRISLTIFISKDAVLSVNNIVKQVRDSLIEKLSPNFGFNQNIYLSKIISICQSVPGVRNCIITEPKFDIFFDFDPYSNMSQLEVLKFTPELIYFDASSIVINTVIE